MSSSPTPSLLHSLRCCCVGFLCTFIALFLTIQYVQPSLVNDISQQLYHILPSSAPVIREAIVATPAAAPVAASTSAPVVVLPSKPVLEPSHKATAVDKPIVVSNKHAVVYLVGEPDDEIYSWTGQLQQSLNNADVFVVADINNGNVSTLQSTVTHSNVTVLHMNDSYLHSIGYYGCGYYQDPGDYVRASDKALYYFTQHPVGKQYQYLWLLESDVFVPSVGHLQRLIDEADQKQVDFISQRLSPTTVNNFDDANYEGWMWWPLLAEAEVAFPWQHTMIAAVGMSRDYLQHIPEWVERYQRLHFIEALLPTIAAQHADLRIWNPDQLSDLTLKETWTLPEMMQAGANGIYHPIKDHSRWSEYRAAIAGMHLKQRVIEEAAQRERLERKQHPIKNRLFNKQRQS